MPMVNVVYRQPTGGLLAHVDWLGSEVGSHWHRFCFHRVNRVIVRFHAMNTEQGQTCITVPLKSMKSCCQFPHSDCWVFKLLFVRIIFIHHK